jgi:hypothetical protein
MSGALRFFVKEEHYCLPEQIRKVIHILLQNGADPFEKNRFDRDAFDYAHTSHERSVMQILLQSSPKNPIRRVNQMIAREKMIVQLNPHRNTDFLEYLQSDKQYYTDQSLFHRTSTKAPLGSHRQKNV